MEIDPENEEVFGIEVTTTSLDGMVDGDKISDWIDCRDENTNIKGLIDIVSHRAFAAMRAYRRENSKDMPAHATCYFSGGAAFISPIKLESIEDKEKFFTCSSEIVYDIGRQYEDKPILVTFTSTAWSCFFRKEALKEIDIAIGKLNIDKNLAKLKLLEEIVGAYGSMEEVPADHPVVGKMDLMLFSAHFLSMDGPVQVTKTSLTNTEILSDLSDDQKMMLDTYMLDKMPRNRITFDVSEYEPAHYDEKDFQ